MWHEVSVISSVSHVVVTEILRIYYHNIDNAEYSGKMKDELMGD